MKHAFTKFSFSLLLVACFISSFFVIRQPVEAATPLHHSTPVVQLRITLGRIYFKPNVVNCSHTAKPCFLLKYISNDGLRPVWLNGSQEYVLHTNQIVSFTFPTPGIELFTLFQHSIWWKIKVIVSWQVYGESYESVCLCSDLLLYCTLAYDSSLSFAWYSSQITLFIYNHQMHTLMVIVLSFYHKTYHIQSYIV